MSYSSVKITHGETNYKLVFNETLLLLSKDDSISIQLDQEVNNWLLKIKFVDNFIETQAMAIPSVEDKGKSAVITLQNWYAQDWVENSDPIKFDSEIPENKLSILVKIRSTANISNHPRSISIAVWKQIF